MRVRAAFRASPCVPARVEEPGVIRVVDRERLYIEGQKTETPLFDVNSPERDEGGVQSSTDHLTAPALGRPLLCDEHYPNKYRRIIGRRCLLGGPEINRLMLEEPFAAEYCRYSKNAYSACK